MTLDEGAGVAGAGNAGAGTVEARVGTTALYINIFGKS
jgi:hypothetical protein